MIKKSTPLSMIEATEHLGKEEGELNVFVGGFSNLKVSEAKELRKKLEELDLFKIGGKEIAKVIDFLPENNEELSKIFIDVGLNEDETKKILDVIKEFK